MLQFPIKLAPFGYSMNAMCSAEYVIHINKIHDLNFLCIGNETISWNTNTEKWKGRYDNSTREVQWIEFYSLPRILLNFSCAFQYVCMYIAVQDHHKFKVKNERKESIRENWTEVNGKEMKIHTEFHFNNVNDFSSWISIYTFMWHPITWNWLIFDFI